MKVSIVPSLPEAGNITLGEVTSILWTSCCDLFSKKRINRLLLGLVICRRRKREREREGGREGGRERVMATNYSYVNNDFTYWLVKCHTPHSRR